MYEIYKHDYFVSTWGMGIPSRFSDEPNCFRESIAWMFNDKKCIGRVL